MSTVPTFSGEISIFDDKDTGLRVECSEKHVPAITSYLNKHGFVCGSPEVAVQGTNNINNFVEFPVTGNLLDVLTATISEHLRIAGVTVVPESFNSSTEKHLRLNLTNVSVYDK